MAMMASMSAGWPAMCTGMTTRVRGVMAASTALGSRLKVSSSMSANTGTALASITAVAVARNVYGGTITSSSALMPAAIRATRRETVPLTTPMLCLAPCMAAKRCSNSATSGPWCLPHLPLRSARSSRASSGSPKIGQAVKGRVRTGVPPRMAKGCDILWVPLLRGSPSAAGAGLLLILRAELFPQLLDVVVQGLLLWLVMPRELVNQRVRQVLRVVDVSLGPEPGVRHGWDAGELFLPGVETRVAVP